MEIVAEREWCWDLLGPVGLVGVLIAEIVMMCVVQPLVPRLIGLSYTDSFAGYCVV